MIINTYEVSKFAAMVKTYSLSGEAESIFDLYNSVEQEFHMVESHFQMWHHDTMTAYSNNSPELCDLASAKAGTQVENYGCLENRMLHFHLTYTNA